MAPNVPEKPFARRRWLTIGAVAGLFMLPAVISHTAGFWHADTVAVGTPAPVFHAQTLDGETVAVDDLSGQITVLNFWATWCGPCRVEMPLLNAAHNPDDDVVVLTINNGEPAKTVQAFAAEAGLTLPLLLDADGRLQGVFGVVGYPTTVFVAPDGVVYAIHAGPLTADQLTDFIAMGRG